MNITLKYLSTDTPLRLEEKGVNFPLSTWALSMICGVVSSIQYHPFGVTAEKGRTNTRHQSSQKAAFHPGDTETPFSKKHSRLMVYGEEHKVHHDAFH